MYFALINFYCHNTRTAAPRATNRAVESIHRVSLCACSCPADITHARARTRALSRKGCVPCAHARRQVCLRSRTSRMSARRHPTLIYIRIARALQTRNGLDRSTTACICVCSAPRTRVATSGLSCESMLDACAPGIRGSACRKHSCDYRLHMLTMLTLLRPTKIRKKVTQHTVNNFSKKSKCSILICIRILLLMSVRAALSPVQAALANFVPASVRVYDERACSYRKQVPFTALTSRLNRATYLRGHLINEPDNVH